MNASRWVAGIVFLALQACATASPPDSQRATRDIPCTGPVSVCKTQALKLSAVPDAIAEPLINDALARAKRTAGNHYPEGDGRDTFQIELDGKTYYLTANTYIEVDENKILESPNKMKPGFCAFYIYDDRRQFVSDIASIKLGNGQPTTCIDIFGVSGVAYGGKPALLAILQYYYTQGPIGHSISQIGDNWIQTAVLLPLVQDRDGKWTFTQDTSCFAPTNTIDTLAKAKAKLATCR